MFKLLFIVIQCSFMSYFVNQVYPVETAARMFFLCLIVNNLFVVAYASAYAAAKVAEA
jgi:hypothetical protein